MIFHCGEANQEAGENRVRCRILDFSQKGGLVDFTPKVGAKPGTFEKWCRGFPIPMTTMMIMTSHKHNCCGNTISKACKTNVLSSHHRQHQSCNTLHQLNQEIYPTVLPVNIPFRIILTSGQWPTINHVILCARNFCNFTNRMKS